MCRAADRSMACPRSEFFVVSRGVTGETCPPAVSALHELRLLSSICFCSKPRGQSTRIPASGLNSQAPLSTHVPSNRRLHVLRFASHCTFTTSNTDALSSPNRKIFFTLSVPILAAVPAVIAEVCQYFDQNLFGGNSGIGFRQFHDNPGHPTWKAQEGDAIIQDDGWAFFDGHLQKQTAEMIIQCKGGKKVTVQPPMRTNGWSTLPSRGQHNIENI
ncbi:hypothetical protein B0J12DRAFT_702130 [Macrophomina phaseolina]|uniref:Uncharacterized protein n=1 Tax=Macrophomina phaseolina TaxID=35725 RepID=A0ABQ8G545_9PEZI|nr:hypothetical protein B0J12DRAFT_702130 [Macrophomina phaseolina]